MHYFTRRLSPSLTPTRRRHLRIHPWRSPGRLGLLALALVAAVFGAGASAARANVPAVPSQTSFKLKFGHSGMVANVANGSNEEGAPLKQYLDLPGFPNDDFKFIKINGPSPNSYLIQAGKTANGLALYVRPNGVTPGAPIVQDRPADSLAVWDLFPSQLPGFVHIVNHVTGYAMNVAGAGMNPGADLILWPPQTNDWLNDDVRILPAT
jgi:hypothetical protein